MQPTTSVVIRHNPTTGVFFAQWHNPTSPTREETIEFSAERIKAMLAQQRYVQRLTDGRVRIQSNQGIVTLTRRAVLAL